MAKEYSLPKSEYYSENFRTVWDELMARYSFHDSTNERTVRNYGSSVKLICDYCKKDFLEIGDADVSRYFGFLDENVSLGKMSVSTANTYKKNLRSVGNHFERMLSAGGAAYISPFRGKVHVENRKSRSNPAVHGKRQEAEDDTKSLLEEIRRNEKPQYYYIFCMMVYFRDVSSIKICGMVPDDICIKDGIAGFRYEMTLRRPKTKVEGRELSEGQRDGFVVTFRLPADINEGFAEFYPMYLERYRKKMNESPETAFYNRNYEPVNLKTLGSIFRKNMKALKKDGKEPAINYIRDICGILYSDDRIAELRS